MAFGNNINLPPSQGGGGYGGGGYGGGGYGGGGYGGGGYGGGGYGGGGYGGGGYAGGGYGGAAGAGAAAAEQLRNSSSGVQEMDPLYHIYQELDMKFNQLIEGHNTSLEFEMPPIQDKHAGLFFMPRNNTGGTINSLMHSINLMLAAKEYLSELPDNNSIKESLAKVVQKHEKLFNKITDITFMLRFAPSAQAHNDAIQFIGKELLTNTAKNAYKFLINELAKKTDSISLRAMIKIKDDRESELRSAYRYGENKKWPLSILPFNMLSSIVNSSALKCYPLAENLIEAAQTYIDARSVKHRVEILRNHIRDGATDTQFYKVFEKLCHELGFNAFFQEINKNKNYFPKSHIDTFEKLLRRYHDKSLNLDLATELNKISYEVSRYTPELVMQEAKKEINFKKHMELNLEGSSLDHLELCLNDDDPKLQERRILIQQLKTSFRDFHVDHGLSLAENIANYFLDSKNRNAIFESINQFIASGSGISNKPSSKKSGKKKKEKASNQKMDELFEKIKIFINRTIPKAIPSSQEQRFTALTHYWMPCTFRSIEDSINYHQMKHSPGDDQVSYMQEAKECMDRELQERPPTPREQYNNRLTRRGHNPQDNTFLRLLRDPHHGDGNWKIATFHSSRFTDQAHEPDGIAKLKAGESYRQYDPEPTDSASYAITQHLMRTKIG